MLGVDRTGSFHLDLLNNNFDFNFSIICELTNERAPLRIYNRPLEYIIGPLNI